MADCEAILKNYSHWDNFIRLWKLGVRPDAPYLPEPWWGWHPASGEKLYSVVVNLSPGQGGKLQSQACVACALGCGIGGLSYSAAMLCGALRAHLADTERWHFRRRYLPLMRALGLSEEQISPDTRNHLSIELAPYHSDSSRLNEEYLKSNPGYVMEHSLRFAARASKLIDNKLKGIVIVRASVDRVRKIVGDRIAESGLHIFHLPDEELMDVSFVCVWGARNNLPTKDLEKIINHNNNNV